LEIVALRPAVRARLPALHAREVGLPLSGLGRRRGQVRLTIRRARNIGSRVIQPLCRYECGGEDECGDPVYRLLGHTLLLASQYTCTQ
jgi:hypothetical protein